MNGQGGRDRRIDIFRGAALLFIYIDHIGGNRVTSLTLQQFAFFDCADLFVFLSGYVSGLVYTKLYLHQGFSACAKKAARRCGQLLVAHVLVASSVFAVLLVFIAQGIALPGKHLYTFGVHPGWVMLNVTLLRHLPGYLTVLPLYILLIGLAPLIARACSKGGIRWLLLPAGLYTFVQFVPQFDLHWYPGRERWEFNPFAWQLIFVLGSFFACGRGREFRPARNRRSYILLTIACLLAIAVIRVGTTPWYANLLRSNLLLDLVPVVPLTGKETAEPLRILNLLMGVWLVSTVAKDSPVWRSGLFKPLELCGQNSLAVFSAGVVLSTFATGLRMRLGSIAEDVALSVLGCAALVVIAEIARQSKAAWRSQATGQGQMTNCEATPEVTYAGRSERRRQTEGAIYQNQGPG